MPTFHTYTPSRQQSPEASFLIFDNRIHVEWATYEGSGSTERWNEDSLLVAADGNALLLAVFDGVTPIPSAKLANGGHIAASHATAGVAAAFADGLRDPADLLLAGNEAISAISARHAITPGDRVETLACTGTLALLDLAAGTFSYAAISDSALVVKPTDGPATRLTGNRVFVFEQSAMSKLQGDQAELDRTRTDVASPFWQTVIHNRGYQNLPDNKGYGVLNGMPAAQVRQYVETPAAPIPLAEIEGFILFTDGAELDERPIPPDRWDRFAADVFRLGALNFVEHVRALEEQDPLLQTYRRVKLHDDSTLIAVRITV